MSRAYFVLIIIACVAFLKCATTQKVTYDIPADYPPARRQQVIDLFEKGKELYRINCAQCHGIFSPGKDSIPNFTQVQFDNYSARFMSGDRLNHAVARKMSPEQLNEVLIFLRYRKRKAAVITTAPKRP